MGTNEFVRNLATFVATLDAAQLPAATLDAARLHAFDSVAAIHAGANTSEGIVTTGVLQRLMPHGGPSAEAAQLCVSARLTECDDIDLWSCTTPGAVVIPVALATSALGAVDPKAFTEGIVAGYQVMTALGVAANGPSIVYGARWPTYLAAAMTAAATVGKMIGLSERRLLHGLAIAASMTTGTAGRIATEPTSRWLTLGYAVQAGIAAAIGASDGLQGDEAIFSACMDLDPQRLGEATPEPPNIERVGLKPYHSSRQALSATEAFASVLREKAIGADAIEEITVLVPAQVSAMIDRSKQPQSKGESRSIRYQLALAACYPDELYDIERHALHTAEPRVGRLLNCVTVAASEPLTELYPRVWPGAVRIKTARGSFEREVLHPRGDVENPLTWEDVAAKWTSVSAFVPATLAVDTLAALIRSGDAAGLRSALLV